MSGFFKSRRRNIGLILLTLPLMLTVVWMRSFVISDCLLLGGRNNVHKVDSCHGILCWAIISDKMPSRLEWYSDSPNPYSEPWGEIEFERGAWRFVGITIGSGQIRWLGEWSRVDAVVTPYWCLVLPLTVFSAYLFFSKPCRVTQSSKTSASENVN